MLLAAVDFCPDHLERIEQRLDGVAAASRIRALPIGPDDFPTAIPPAFILDRPEHADRNGKRGAGTFIFKLRVIAFIVRTSVGEFGGRARRKMLILLRMEECRANGKIAPIDVFVDVAPGAAFGLRPYMGAFETLKQAVGENVDYGTRKGLHPLLRSDIEREAIRIF
jgi:hypothetical protein